MKYLICLGFLMLPGCAPKCDHEIVDLFHDTMKKGEGVSIKIEPIKEPRD